MSNVSIPSATPPTARMNENANHWLENFKGLFRNTEFVILLIVLFLFAVGGIINPRFLSVENLKILTRDTAMLGIAAIGVGFTILVAGIDLSVGSIVGLGGVVVAYLMIVLALPIWVAIPLTLLLAFAIGMGHGLYVTKLKMHGFLITLVTFGLARGFTLVITNGFPVTGLPTEFNFLGQGYVSNLIPIPVIICAIIAVAAYYLLRFTYIGRQIYAAGGNMEAARFVGRECGCADNVVLCDFGHVRDHRRHDYRHAFEFGASELGRRIRAASDCGVHPRRRQFQRR